MGYIVNKFEQVKRDPQVNKSQQIRVITHGDPLPVDKHTDMTENISFPHSVLIAPGALQHVKCQHSRRHI